MGAMLYKTSCVPEDTIIAFDRRYALKWSALLRCRSITTRSWTASWTGLLSTAIVGFGKLFPDAVRVMTVKKGFPSPCRDKIRAFFRGGNPPPPPAREPGPHEKGDVLWKSVKS